MAIDAPRTATATATAPNDTAGILGRDRAIATAASPADSARR